MGRLPPRERHRRDGQGHAPNHRRRYKFKPRGKRSAERVCWESLGSIVNVHSHGDESQFWPRPAPHLNVLLASWKLTNKGIEKLRSTWPEHLDKTRDRYRDELRRAFMPILPIDLHHAITGDFPVIFHASNMGRMLTKGRAHHKVRYSARPLIDLGIARVEDDPAVGLSDNPAVLVYPVKTKDGHKLEHRVPLQIAMTAIYRRRQLLEGKNRVRWEGTLSKGRYPDVVREFTPHEPVFERPRGEDGKGGMLVSEPIRIDRRGFHPTRGASTPCCPHYGNTLSRGLP